MPKVSVITGYYNRAEFLEGTVRSILSQSFDDLELIVFDDASTDGGGEVLMELAAKLGDPRLKPIVHPENVGFVRGMIAAIARAEGEYIAIQGSGDLSLPTRIAKQSAYLDAHPDVGVVGCYYTNVVADSGIRRVRRPMPQEATFENLAAGGNIYSHGEVMIRRSVYDAVGGYRAAFVNSQDIDLWLRIVQVARLGVVPEQLYERYIRMDGVSYAPRKFPIQARYSMLARRFARLAPPQAREAVDRLEREGPLPLVPLTDPELQKRYVKAALRSIIWGATEEARLLIQDNIANPTVRSGLLAIATFCGLPIGRPALGVVRKAFKVA